MLDRTFKIHLWILAALLLLAIANFCIDQIQAKEELDNCINKAYPACENY